MTSRLRIAAVALGAVAVLFVVSGSGGYSAMEADRSIAVDVVSDEAALLGIERDVVEADNATIEVLTVTNRFPVAMTVDIDLERSDEGSPDVELESDEFTLEPGETHEIEMAVDCNVSANETAADGTDVAIDVSGTGPGTRVGLSRSAEIGCTG